MDGQQKKPIYKKWWFWVAGLFVLAAIVGRGGSSSISPETTSTATTASAPAPEAEPVLELQSWSWGEEYGYAKVTGTVKNISNQPLKNVEAVGIFSDKDGNMVSDGSALIEYDPILPGQISPFHAMATSNPAMKTARVEFKELMGGTLKWRTKEKKK